MIMEETGLNVVKDIANLGAVGSLLILSCYGLYKGILYIIGYSKERMTQVETLTKEHAEAIDKIHKEYQEQLRTTTETFNKERADLLTSWNAERKESLVALNNLTQTVQKMYDLVEKRDGNIERHS
jgi:glutamate synthase domain-containing protein 3